MDDLTPQELIKIDFSPLTNEKVITVIKEEDGNYRGFMRKNGKVIQARQGDPQTVLVMLITHP